MDFIKIFMLFNVSMLVLFVDAKHESGSEKHLAKVSTGVQLRNNDARSCRQRPDSHWNIAEGSCLPCTKCHPLGLVTLLGCSPTKDALCGTMQDFKVQMEEQMKLRGQSGEKKQSWQTYKVTLSDEASFQEEDNEVYGKPVQFSSNSGEKTKSKWIKNKKEGATQQVRQTVKNLSQRKKEFLRQLQEKENLGEERYSKESESASPLDDLLEGQVKLAVEPPADNHPWIRSGNLHEDLMIIEKELLNDGLDDDESTSLSLTTSSPISTTQQTLTTVAFSDSPTSLEQFNENNFKGNISFKNERFAKPSTPTTAITTMLEKENLLTNQMESYLPENDQLPVLDDVQVNQKKLIPSTETYDNESNEDVFGAVVNKASLMEDDPNKITDEFGLLSKILYKNDLEGNHQKDGTSSPEGVVGFTHGMAVVGFVIGFSLVFLIGLLYTKVIKMKKFKILDNTGISSLEDASFLASRNSSLQSQAHTPLLRDQQQSSQPNNRTVVTSLLETDLPLVTTEATVSPSGSDSTSSGNVHASYVERSRRTSLKPLRELPV